MVGDMGNVWQNETIFEVVIGGTSIEFDVDTLAGSLSIAIDSEYKERFTLNRNQFDAFKLWVANVSKV